MTAAFWLVAPPALLAGGVVSAMLFVSRLPATLDFILPRRAGWPLFALTHEALSRPGIRQVFVAAVSLLLLGALGRFVWLSAGAVRGRRWTLWDFLTRGFQLALTVALLRWSFTVWFEVAQKVWFPFGSLNAWEPFANFSVCSVIIFTGMRAALMCLSSRREAFRVLFAWAALNASAAFAAYGAYGAWTVPPAAAVEGRRLFVVLTEQEGRPGQAAYDMPLTASPQRPFPRVRRLESLRALYEHHAKLQDPSGLRSALMLGVKYDDELARSLLLAHLSVAPPSPEALGALGALADETRHQIGAMGASRIALAYARLGDAAQAAVWAERGAVGPRGIPAGLLDLSGGGALKPGRISGRFSGLKPGRVALYRKADPVAPYLLDAAGLVAAAEPDTRGRFSFTGLGAGRYYLAMAFDAPGGEIVVSGHRGDLILEASKPLLELPPLILKITPSRP